jgi:hypothetical protein
VVAQEYQERIMTKIPIQTNLFILSEEEVRAVVEELQHTYVNKENEAYTRVLNKMSSFLSQQEKEHVGQSQDN